MEEVLTTYTKLNRSASIFLGGNSKTNPDRPPPRPASQTAPNAAGAVTEPALPRRREMSEESLDTRALEEGSTGNGGRAGRMNLGEGGAQLGRRVQAQDFAFVSEAILHLCLV